VHGKLVPSKPTAAVQPKNMTASTTSEPNSVTKLVPETVGLTTPASNQTMNPLATVQPKCFPKSAAMGKPPQKPKSKTSEKAKASCFKIFLADDGKTCYLALDTHDQELSPDQMKTAQIIAFQTAKRLGCKVTEPPQMILIKTNNSNAIDKKLIPQLANTKVFNVMFKLDERAAHKEDGKQPKITDQPRNSSDSSHNENNSVNHESTNKESELPSMEDPLDLDTLGDRPSSPMDLGSSQINSTPDNVQIGEASKSTVDTDLSQSNSTPEKDVEIIEEVDRSEPIVISDDSDCETENDAQSSPSSKYTSVTSESHSSDLIGADPLAVILPVSQTPLPEQPKQYVPMIRSTPEKSASFSSLAPTTLPKIVGFPKPIIQLPKPKSAKAPTTPAQASSTIPAQVPAVSAPAPTIAANCAPSFITKQNADGQNETFMVWQPGTNLNDTMVGLVQLPNGQKGLLTLPASVVQSLAKNSAQAGKVPPQVCIGNPPTPKVMPVSAPVSTTPSTKKVITVSAPVPTKKVIKVGMPATSKPSTPIAATSAPAATAVTSKPAGVKTTKKYETVRAKLTVPANMEYKEFQDSVANFVIEPWVKAMETNFSSDPVMTQCRVAQFTFKAINETVRLCEQLGIEKSSTKMTNLQNKAQEVNAQMR